jgi:hypothetical protein
MYYNYIYKFYIYIYVYKCISDMENIGIEVSTMDALHQQSRFTSKKSNLPTIGIFPDHWLSTRQTKWVSHSMSMLLGMKYLQKSTLSKIFVRTQAIKSKARHQRSRHQQGLVSTASGMWLTSDLKRTFHTISGFFAWPCTGSVGFAATAAYLNVHLGWLDHG